ncbi:redox-sensitive bicupin YhaK (pirin superfamily) [Kitasatospora sp. MAP12-15]|uniref:pirin family protein n=1 Tax=unclassified Kitasatospora TaxID=2633591 RepID=UPI002473194E|nr:pirin family protein [Kitasatospora sp. MAP12-44]MDH6108077.1 redox-sensitive bicupin YhaK (pirin superfamily) [Kitasatospora sp. MAP12-44]
MNEPDQTAATVRGGRQDVPSGPVRELLAPRETALGGSTVVRRLLPGLGRRMVGAWCFVDHYGPDDIADEPGMQVPPHPHIGLQTVSWLHQGEVLHRDSLGSLQTVQPRELGLMTSGRGISHSEESPRPHARFLLGAQLWVALPEAHRHTAPAFEHHARLPEITAAGLHGTVILGSIDGATSPGSTHTPLVGVDLSLREGGSARLPLDPDFEYAVLTMSGLTEVDGVRLEPGSMLYLGSGRRELPLRALADGSLLLLGGEPFEEKLVMWWNFIGRSGEEINQAREDWMTGTRFGTVHGYDGIPVPAPQLPTTPLKARGRIR